MSLLRNNISGASVGENHLQISLLEALPLFTIHVRGDLGSVHVVLENSSVVRKLVGDSREPRIGLTRELLCDLSMREGSTHELLAAP